MRIISFIADYVIIHKILNHLELPTEPPIISPARGPPMDYDQQEMEFDDVFDDIPENNFDQSVRW